MILSIAIWYILIKVDLLFARGNIRVLASASFLNHLSGRLGYFNPNPNPNLNSYSGHEI